MDITGLLAIVCLLVSISFISLLILFGYVVEEIRTTAAFWVLLVSTVVLFLVAFTIIIKYAVAL